MKKALIALVILLAAVFVFMMIRAQDTGTVTDSGTGDQRVYPKVDTVESDEQDSEDEDENEDGEDTDEEGESEEMDDDKVMDDDSSESDMVDDGESSESDESSHTDASSDTDVEVEVEVSADASAGSYAPYTDNAIASADGKVVLAFFADWCPSCNAADKDLTENGNDIPSGVTVLKVNYDDATELKDKYGVTAQHTFVQVDSAGELLDKWRGGERVAEIVARVQ